MLSQIAFFTLGCFAKKIWKFIWEKIKKAIELPK